MAKPWYQSKTVWVNLLTLIATIIGVVAQSDFLKAHPVATVKIMGALSVVNIILRFLTAGSLTAVKADA